MRIKCNNVKKQKKGTPEDELQITYISTYKIG